jgi:exonuclease III
MDNLKNEPLGLISLNINGMGDINKRNNVFEWLKKQHCAENKITFLQETHTNEKMETAWENEWENSRIIFSHGDSGSKGVAIIIPKMMDFKLHEVIRSKNGRYIALHIDINENEFCLINCYAPNTNKPKDQLKWLTEIQTILEKHS